MLQRNRDLLQACKPLWRGWLNRIHAVALHTAPDSIDGSGAASGSGNDDDSGWSDEGLDPEAAAFLAELRRDAKLMAELGDEAEGPDRLTEEGVPADQQRLLQVAVVGAPNAGKSTLVNMLVGTKVSAVSPKTNTTWFPRLGAFTSGAAQVVLYDTPGVVGQDHYLSAAHGQRVRGSWATAADCDLLLCLVDAAREVRRPDPRVARVLADSARLGQPADSPPQQQPPPAVLVLNKADALPKHQRPLLLPLADRLRELRSFEDVFYISALDGRGVPELRDFLAERATPGAWSLDAELATDRGEGEMAVEAVREQVFLKLYDELPYMVQLRLTSCLPAADGTMHIEMDLEVPQESQKRILLGRGGDTVAAMSRGATAELQRMWGIPVRLQLRVRVHKPH